MSPWRTLLQSFFSVLLMCISHSLGLSGCSCSACLTGKTQHFGNGFLPSCFVHQLLNCSSVFMHSGDAGAGAGASAKALLVSAPGIIIPSGAAGAQNSRAAGCSTQLAHVWASVAALPHLFPPLHVPLAFCLLPSLCRYVHTKGSIVASVLFPVLSMVGCGGGVGSPNVFCALCVSCCLNSDCSHKSQSGCFMTILLVSFTGSVPLMVAQCAASSSTGHGCNDVQLSVLFLTAWRWCAIVFN